jgi:hypothetical protein
MNAHLAIVQCVLAAAGLAACLWLFVSLKWELWAAARRLKTQHAEAEALLAQVRGELRDLGNRIGEVEGHAGLLVAPAPVLSGLNLSKRSQAIRMSRRGDAPSQIAAALQLPLREVELLLKVHRIVLNLPVSNASQAQEAGKAGP